VEPSAAGVDVSVAAGVVDVSVAVPLPAISGAGLITTATSFTGSPAAGVVPLPFCAPCAAAISASFSFGISTAPPSPPELHKTSRHQNEHRKVTTRTTAESKRRNRRQRRKAYAIMKMLT